MHHIRFISLHRLQSIHISKRILFLLSLMGVLFRLSGLLLSLLFMLSFCNGKNMTVKIVGFIDCTNCIIQESDSNQTSLGLKVAISCKSKNGEMQIMGNGGVGREGKFNITLSNQITDDETKVQGCLAKLYDTSGAPCPIQTAQTASMKIIRSEDNGTQTADVTQKLKFSPGTCQSAFFWPFIRYKFFGQPNITYVPKLSPPPPPLQAHPPPAPAPVSIDPSLPPTQSMAPPFPPAQSPIQYSTLAPAPAPGPIDPSLPPTQSMAPPFPPAQSPIQYSTSAPVPGPIDPSLPPTQLAPPPVHQNSVPPPTPACKYPSSPPVQSLPPTIPPAPVKGPYPTLAPPPSLTFESPISPPVPAPPLSPPPYAQAPAPSSKKPNTPPSPIMKTPLSPSAPKLPSGPNSPPSNGNSIIIPRAPPVPKLPTTPTVPRRFFNPPKSKYLPPHPSHHLH